MVLTMIHFFKCLVAIGWKRKTIGISKLHGETSSKFVEDGDSLYTTHVPTWICVFFSRTIPLRLTYQAI
jgi:hypothetical protein